MTTNEQKRAILKKMIELLELPESAYQQAEKRYKDLGEWFDREESTLAGNDPHIFPQGSFRLGTAIRPLDESEEYDLDLACKLRKGVSTENATQEHLKKIVGQELEAYRTARGIENELEAKHRCWRLEYQDDLSFHMDVVPCLPAGSLLQKSILASMSRVGLDAHVASAVSLTTVHITDDRHQGYKQICDNWHVSNPEGYARWFEYRMNLQQTGSFAARAQVDDVPLFKRKSPLQRVIQLLKRHRDNWSKDDPDVKPISIIITTLAAKAYNGEVDIEVALENILGKMDAFINKTKPKVPNPVNPEEDFADRWYRHDCLHLKLEDHFRAWLALARRDFRNLTLQTDTMSLSKQIEEKLSLRITPQDLQKQLGITAGVTSTHSPKSHVIKPREIAKPWLQ